VPRPPRTPWIAPQRKVAVAGIAVAGALVFIGAGVGIGAAAFGSDDRHGPVNRFDRPGPYDGRGPVFPGYPGYPKFPNGPRHLPHQSATPTPSPSTS